MASSALVVTEVGKSIPSQLDVSLFSPGDIGSSDVSDDI